MLLDWAGKPHKDTDALSDETHLAVVDNGLTCAAVAGLLIRNGVLAKSLTHVTAAHILAELDAGRPAIALIDYGYIIHRQNQADTGGHFVCVTGYDAQWIYVNDPDFWGDRVADGNGLALTRAEFDRALANSPAPYSAIFLAS